VRTIRRYSSANVTEDRNATTEVLEGYSQLNYIETRLEVSSLVIVIVRHGRSHCKIVSATLLEVSGKLSPI
jgi:hypothetical protein